MVGERLGLSKARSNFGVVKKRLNITKFLHVPVGRPLTDCALLSRFGCAERYKSVPEMYRFCCGLFAVALETVWVLYARRACYSLP